MIKSWANRPSQRFYKDGKISKFRGLDVDAADDLLASLDAAESLNDLSPLKSVELQKSTTLHDIGCMLVLGHGFALIYTEIFYPVYLV